MSEPIMMLPLTLDEFEIRLGRCVADSVATALQKQQGANEPEKYLTRSEASDFLHIGLQTLNAGTRTGKFNGYRVGARVLYKKSELEAAMVPTNQYTVPGAKRGPKPKARA